MILKVLSEQKRLQIEQNAKRHFVCLYAPSLNTAEVDFTFHPFEVLYLAERGILSNEKIVK